MDLPQATGPVAPTMSPGRAETDSPEKNHFLIIFGIAIRIIVGVAIAGVLIGKRHFFDRHVRALRDSKLFERLRPFHHRADPLPRNFGLPHGVEELGRLGGLDRQFRKAGQKRRERRDVKRCGRRDGETVRSRPVFQRKTTTRRSAQPSSVSHKNDNPFAQLPQMTQRRRKSPTLTRFNQKTALERVSPSAVF